MTSNDSAGAVAKKFDFFQAFWKGEGAFPILFTQPHLAKGALYCRHDLVEQHRSIEKHLEERLQEVEPHLRLIDDGIPTVRADMGTTLLPSGLGLEIKIQADLHPWLTQHFSPEELLTRKSPVRVKDFLHNEVAFAEAFYRLFFERKRQGLIPETVYPYVPETEGIFDLSHLLIGTELFLLLEDRPELAHRIQRKSLELYRVSTRFFKELLGEQPKSMVHGHGMPIGVWFPDTGARISEDSCTLLSGAMIRELCLPYIQQSARPFGRLFLHYCGYHLEFLRLACELEEISTLNLGNPEMYDLEEVMAICGSTDTVLFGHIPRQGHEEAENYLHRLAGLCRKSRARLILVSDYQPESREEKAALVECWHKLTAVGP
jgi:hypothetical protein